MSESTSSRRYTFEQLENTRYAHYINVGRWRFLRLMDRMSLYEQKEFWDRVKAANDRGKEAAMANGDHPGDGWAEVIPFDRIRRDGYIHVNPEILEKLDLWQEAAGTYLEHLTVAVVHERIASNN